MKIIQYLVLSIILASGLLFSIFGVGISTSKINAEGTRSVEDGFEKIITTFFGTTKPVSGQLSKASWEGEAKGYISAAEPANSQVEYLIRLAKVSAAVNDYSRFALESRKADSSVMEVFWKIEAVSSVSSKTQNLYASIKNNLKERNIRSVELELIKLAEPESISALANHDYDKRNEKRQIEAKLDAIQYSLSEDAYETSSVSDVMLASSALLREAGELLEQAVSENGLILDQVAFYKAASLIEATKAVKLASNYPYCDDEVSKANNVRHGVDELESKLHTIQFADKGRNNKLTAVNIGEVYTLADETHRFGMTQTVSGSRYANIHTNSCSQAFFVSHN